MLRVLYLCIFKGFAVRDKIHPVSLVWRTVPEPLQDQGGWESLSIPVLLVVAGAAPAVAALAIAVTAVLFAAVLFAAVLFAAVLFTAALFAAAAAAVFASAAVLLAPARGVAAAVLPVPLPLPLWKQAKSNTETFDPLHETHCAIEGERWASWEDAHLHTSAELNRPLILCLQNIGGRGCLSKNYSGNKIPHLRVHLLLNNLDCRMHTISVSGCRLFCEPFPGVRPYNLSEHWNFSRLLSTEM